MGLKNLALTKSEAKDTMMGCAPCEPDVDNAPKYPWGTALDLDDETLSKLDMDKLPDVGVEVTITAKAKITRKSENEDQGGVRRSLGVQITDMSIGDPSQSAESKLYKDTTGSGNPLG